MSARYRMLKVLDVLCARYPAQGALEIGTPYHLLVLVMLSARTRDEQVLTLAPGFFRAFPTVERLAKADVAAIAAKINTIGMYKQKAKHLQAMAQAITVGVGHARPGEIPHTMTDLVSLPGVGRKTASVVLAAAFSVPAIAVDTHVMRVVGRIMGEERGVATVRPEMVERALRRVVPEERWTDINHVFVPFGRSICIPGVPRCWMCPVQALCAYGQKHVTKPKNAEVIAERIVQRERAMGELKARAAKRV